MKPDDIEKKILAVFDKLGSYRLPLFPSLGKKKADGNGLEYATFSGRMFAMTLDMLLLILLFLPIFQWLETIVFPGFDREAASAQVRDTVMALAQGTITPQEAYRAAQSSGIIAYLAFNHLAQMAATGLAVIWAWNRTATTPGLWLLGMYIADADTGGKPTLRQFILRYLGLILAMIPLTLGMIWIIFDRRNQGWHDKLANTVVIRKPRDLFGWMKKKSTS